MFNIIKYLWLDDCGKLLRNYILCFTVSCFFPNFFLLYGLPQQFISNFHSTLPVDTSAGVFLFSATRQHQITSELFARFHLQKRHLPAFTAA